MERGGLPACASWMRLKKCGTAALGGHITGEDAGATPTYGKPNTT